MRPVLTVTVLLGCVQGLVGFVWRPDLADYAVLQHCSGQDAELLWAFTASPGDVIHDVQWFSHTNVQQMIAFSSHGISVAIPAYTTRVKFVPNAGIVISGVTSADRGNYSVEVSGNDASGASFLYIRSAYLEVTNLSDVLHTTDGRLHAQLEPQPVYDAAADQWSLVLSCGNFTYLGQPPFVVEWLKPSGDVPSVRYEEGRYLLHVTRGGEYTCRIPDHTTACLTSSTAVNITVHVGATEARLLLLEARQERLEADNRRLQHDNLLLNNALNSFTQTLQAVNSSGGKQKQLGFYGRLYHDGKHAGRVPFSWDVTNIGAAFAPSAGTFTAPLTGLYVLQLSATPAPNNTATAAVKVDGRNACYAFGSVPEQSVTCATVQHLAAGSQAWVESGHSELSSVGTHFAGFLLATD